MTPEGCIKRDVKYYLKLKGWFVFHNQQSALSYPGITDLTAIKDGVVLWVEIKTPKSKLHAAQEIFKAEIERHAGKYITVRSVEDLKNEGVQ